MAGAIIGGLTTPRPGAYEDATLTDQDTVVDAHGSAAEAAGHDDGIPQLPAGFAAVLHDAARSFGLPLALLAALAAGLLTANGLAYADLLGRGYSRYIPFIDIWIAVAIAPLLVLRPWHGLAAWVFFMGILNIAHGEVVAGSFQLILSSVMLPALAVGWIRAIHLGEIDAPAALRTRDPATITWLVAAAISLLAAGSAVLTGTGAAGLTIALHGIVEPAVLAALIVSLRPSRNAVFGLVLALAGSVAFSTVFGLYRLTRFLEPLTAAGQRSEIAYFTYFNVGIYGDLLAMSLPVLVGCLLLRRELGLSRAAIVAVAVALLISVPGLVLTYSKSSWLGAGAAVFVVVLLALRSTRARLAFVALTVIGSALVVPWPAVPMRAVGIDTSAYTRIVTRISGDRLATWDPTTPQGEVSITERVLAIQAGVRMAVDHPLFGVGPNEFATAYANGYREKQSTRLLTSAHNFLPDLAAEYGVPIALLVAGSILAVLLALLRVLRLRDRQPGEWALAVAIGGGLVGFLIVASTFGLDLYRSYRVMNADVLSAALLLGAAISLAALAFRREGAGRHDTDP